MQPTPYNHPGSKEWYAVYCSPLKEWQAACALTELLGLQVYLPEVRQHFRGELRRAPVFPRYLFIRANLGRTALSKINTMPGVLRLVAFGDMPQPIPNAFMHDLHQRVEALNAAGGLPTHAFQPGQKVQLRKGPLQGLDAIFVGPTTPSERVKVLLELLGRLHQVEISADALESRGFQPVPRQGRSTRGRGRRINQR